jgi:[protein-PII] uridylyltransferase
VNSAPPIDTALSRIRELGDESGTSVAALVREYLAEAREYLIRLHRDSGSGHLVTEANSDLTDRMVRQLFALAEQMAIVDGAEPQSGLAVVAVGGYARREMCLYSDVDLLVLYREPLSPFVTSIAEHLQHWLWDAGLTVGCATRTIEETVALAWQDNLVRTAVLTVRFLCGDGEFFHRFAESIRAELVPDPALFVEQQEQNMRARHAQYGESLFLLQPNLKQGPGALRDYHTAYWMVRGTQPSVRDLNDFLHIGLLTEDEVEAYRAGLDFLWRVRNELHYQTGRATDQMNFELQESLAEALGYGTSPPASDQLPVERFMGDYYRHARAIQDYSQLVIEQCRAWVASPARRQETPVEEGLRVVDDHLEIEHAVHLRGHPVNLLKAFEIARRHGVRLSRMARRLVRENLHLVNDELRRSPEAAASFLDILKGDTLVSRTLMSMNEVGLLAVYLPEWEHIVCRWQHVLYHTYTVDVHSIFLVGELGRLSSGKYASSLPELTELMRQVEDRPVLYLGCLLHDIGKGMGGDHSARSAELARGIVERLGLDRERGERVMFLARYHLLMSHLAQRRDLSDLQLILEFAKLCGDITNLRLLYLLTFADIRASSRDAWTPWKGQLLQELYGRTVELLESERKDATTAMELIDARVEKRKQKARRELGSLGVSGDEIESYFDHMPRRYFVSHTWRQIARHASVALRYASDGVMCSAFRQLGGDSTEFILCSDDVPGLYSKVAGTLTACGLNILGSYFYTTRNRLALEVYHLTTPSGGRQEIGMALRRLQEALQGVLSGEVVIEELLARRRPPVGKARPPAAEPPRVSVSNRESELYTIVDVSADDRIGLLYDLTRTIEGLGLEIYLSKAATVHDQVADTFYLKDREGNKLRDPELLEHLQQALTAAVLRERVDTRG